MDWYAEGCIPAAGIEYQEPEEMEMRLKSSLGAFSNVPAADFHRWTPTGFKTKTRRKNLPVFFAAKNPNVFEERRVWMVNYAT